MKPEIADCKKLEYDLSHHLDDLIKQDLQVLVDDIFGVGNYCIIKLEGDK